VKMKRRLSLAAMGIMIALIFSLQRASLGQDTPTEPAPTPAPSPIITPVPVPVPTPPTTPTEPKEPTTPSAPVPTQPTQPSTPAPTQPTAPIPTTPVPTTQPGAPAPMPVEANQFQINYLQPVTQTYVSQILKKQPIIDGVIGNDEWSKCYTLQEGGISGTIYMNWDDNNVYIAAQTDKPAWLVVDLDCNGDGWLRGADNLEITVSPVNNAAKPAITTRLLDALSINDSPTWNDTAVSPSSINVAEKADGAGQVIEMAIPKGVAGLNPRENASMMFRADFLPADATPVPTKPYEPHKLLDVILVDTRTVTVPGITPILKLNDVNYIPGENLDATLKIASQLSDPIQIQSITWQGIGPASNLVNTLRQVNIPVIKPLKSITLKYHSQIPNNAILGYYQFETDGVLANGKTFSNTTSFSIVEPFNLSITTVPPSVAINSVGETQLKVDVNIFSAVPGYAQGDVELSVPTGWEVKGRSKKGFYIDREDVTRTSHFYVLVPNAMSTGDYDLKATISWHGKTWVAHHIVHVSGLSVSAGANTKPDTSTDTTKPATDNK
jgi:hypothetical protein